MKLKKIITSVGLLLLSFSSFAQIGDAVCPAQEDLATLARNVNGIWAIEVRLLGLMNTGLPASKPLPDLGKWVSARVIQGGRAVCQYENGISINTTVFRWAPIGPAWNRPLASKFLIAVCESFLGKTREQCTFTPAP